MCCSWSRVCCSLHILYNLVYIAVGAIQIILGILLLISLPAFKLSSNLWTGTINIVIGVLGTVISCVGDFTNGKQQAFLCLTVIILGANLTNLIFLEAENWKLFAPNEQEIARRNSKTFSYYGVTFSYAQMSTITTLVAMLLSFLDSQFTFCSLQRKAGRKDSFSHPDIITDIEYILPRVKFDSQKNGKEKSEYFYDEYAQSWVFDADTLGSQGDNHCQSTYKSQNDFNLNKTYSVKLNRDFLNINNIKCSSSPVRPSPVDIIVEGEPPVNSANKHGLPLQCLTSFNNSPQTASPLCLSESSSLNSLSNKASEQPIYECLEKIIEPSVYQSQLNSSKSQSLELEDEPRNLSLASTSACPCPVRNVELYEQPQYASLLVELQKTINEKFPRLSDGNSNQNSKPNSRRPSMYYPDETLDDKNETVHSETETETETETDQATEVEFSKELEAALQIIQNLESPNPSDQFDKSLTLDSRADLTSAAN